MDIRTLTRPITADLMRSASSERDWVQRSVRIVEGKLAERAGRDSKKFPEFNKVDIGIYDLAPYETRKRRADEAVARGQKEVSGYTQEQVREMFWNENVEALAKEFEDRGFTTSLSPYCSCAGGICCDLVVSWNQEAK